MWVKIPMMVDDVRFATLGQKDATERVEIEDEFFLDGPVTRQVAVIDLNADTGKLEDAARFIPPKPGEDFGKYDVPAVPDTNSRTFNLVSVFATVRKTMQLYERDDTLGREVTWAFGSPQLLVVPRAGARENAFYDRKSHSLQFFYFKDHLHPENTIYSSLARDIVAHETGHAILDGIAPHLMNSVTPQSLALHEAIGDLTALLVSIDSGKLRRAVLDKTHGSIADTTHFSAIAEDFGMGRGTLALRTLLNQTKMADVARADPHDVCMVLTGALYAMLQAMHEKWKRSEMQATGRTEFQVSGKALANAANQFRRMAFRSLDYLPLGEVSFADYGRAIIAADKVAHPKDEDDEERQHLVEQFVTRGIVANAGALKVDLPDEKLDGIDLEGLLESDWAAYDFANSPRGRGLLGIPVGVPFHVEPRLETEKVYWHKAGDPRGQQEVVREILFKVWWYQEEPAMRFGMPSKRQVPVGTTMSWDRDTSKLRVLLTSARAARPDEQEEQQADRNSLLELLSEKGLLRSPEQAVGPTGKPLGNTIIATADHDVLRLEGTGRMLHIATEA